MPPIVKAAELAVQALEHIAPGEVKSALNLLEVAGEKAGLAKTAPFKVLDKFSQQVSKDLQDVRHVHPNVNRAIDALSFTPGAASPAVKREFVSAAREELSPIRDAHPKIDNAFKTLDDALKLPSDNVGTKLDLGRPIDEKTIASQLSAREKTLAAFVGDSAGREKFAKALDRIDEANIRKAEAGERAARIKKDPEALLAPGGSLVKTTRFERGEVEKMEEHSSGKLVTSHRRNYPVVSHKITEEPDGTRIIESHNQHVDGVDSQLYRKTIEHPNGDLEHHAIEEHHRDGMTKWSKIFYANGAEEGRTETELLRNTGYARDQSGNQVSTYLHSFLSPDPAEIRLNNLRAQILKPQ